MKPVASPLLVPFDGSFRAAEAPTALPDAPGKKKSKKKLEEIVEEIELLQRVLYADNRHSLLILFQAMDAAGKDGTIRAVTSGVNPAGFQVFSFKKPSAEELDHDYLWRSATRLPERGRIGIFNRSYYEEVLAVRVHPEFLAAQRLPRGTDDLEALWAERFESIRDHERHLARNGTTVLKFWLNVSRDEQRRRLVDRIDQEHKNWKFSLADVTERGFWDDYQRAFEEALNETSRPWAPWYAVPADDKPAMRVEVARLIRDTLRGMDLRYPEVGPERKAELEEIRRRLEKDRE